MRIQRANTYYTGSYDIEIRRVYCRAWEGIRVMKNSTSGSDSIASIDDVTFNIGHTFEASHKTKHALAHEGWRDVGSKLQNENGGTTRIAKEYMKSIADEKIFKKEKDQPINKFTLSLTQREPFQRPLSSVRARAGYGSQAAASTCPRASFDRTYKRVPNKNFARQGTIRGTNSRVEVALCTSGHHRRYEFASRGSSNFQHG